MKILKYPLGQLQANCYFLIIDKECLIIDPGDSADFISEEIVRNGYSLIGQIATHGHFDHVMAAGEIYLNFKKPLLINHKDSFLIQRLGSTAKHFLGHTPEVVDPVTENLKGKTYKLGAFWFEVFKTPGHTPGSCCIYFKDKNVIFTGDTLFKGAIGSYEHSYSSYEELKRSLSLLLKLPESTVIYPGHGPETSVDEEKNPDRY